MNKLKSRGVSVNFSDFLENKPSERLIITSLKKFVLYRFFRESFILSELKSSPIDIFPNTKIVCFEILWLPETSISLILSDKALLESINK